MDYNIDKILTENGIIIENTEKFDKYAIRKRLLAYLKELKALEYKTDEGQRLFKTLFEYLTFMYRPLYTAYQEDTKELDACFSAKAYKATLILAGSILEAFLLDWLSEIDGKNYFEQDYMQIVEDRDGTRRWEKKECLCVYIDRIKEIERPEWMEESSHAHYIREKRNSVHAKICLKEDIEINEETCKTVIMYLNEIVNTRLDKINKELAI